MNSVRKNLGVKICLQIVALVVVISVFLKSLIDVDVMWDTWAYHLPFAGRIWRIIPPENYIFGINHEHRYDGFPLLGEAFQGFFWWITGRVQTANVVCFLSVIIYVYFLKVYFKITLYASAIALLAIPLVLTHATTCYVDLPGNIGIATLIMMTYVLYQQKTLYTKRDLLVIFVAAFSASNIKPQLEPLVFLVLGFIVLRIVWLRFKIHSTSHQKWLFKAIPIGLIASLLIFATPIKNIALYGNPFYPVKIEIAGKVLNYALPLYSDAPDYLKNTPKAQRWLYSILEINSPEWTVDQYSNDPAKNRMGGFFGAYVIFHLLLLGCLAIIHRCRKTTVAVVVALIMSLVAANYPQSHELRYFIYWMIALVSLNLALVADYEQLPKKNKIINLSNLGLVSVFALAIVATKTQFTYIKPNFYSLDKFILEHVDYGIISAIQPEARICLVKKSPYSFAYSSWFHSYLNYDYLIKEAGDISQCTGDEKILASSTAIKKYWLSQ
jgi:hypothetical protein